MNGHDRIMAALNGRKPDQPPIMLHNFMMAAREYGVTMAEFRSSAKTIASAFIQSVEKYELDGIVIDVDTATLAGSVGVPVDFPINEPARCVIGAITDLQQLDELPEPAVSEYPGVQVWLEAVGRVSDYFGDEILVRGNCDQCPFSLASMIRSPMNWMMDLLDEPNIGRVDELLEYATLATSQFIRLMAATGAHIVSNGDSSAGPEMISPQMYRRFALPYEQRIVDLAHELGKPYILHICGKTEPILQDMITSGADAFEVDQKTDASVASQALRDRATFIGNIDPSAVLTFGRPQDVERATLKLLEVFRNNPRFILNAGCAIPAEAPEENLRAMIRAARSA